MKLLEKTKLTFLTPCFCAGADQKVAEIRVTAIRAELRWWFRCLGGSKRQESLVFGSAAGSSESASSLLVRISDIQFSDTYHQPTYQSINDPGSYHHYFLTAPNKNLNDQSRMWATAPDSASKTKGTIRKESQIPPGSSFILHIFQVRNYPIDQQEEIEKLLSLTIQCLKLFGSIGFRKTRGFGAWQADGSALSQSELTITLNQLKNAHQFSYNLGNGANKWETPFNQIETKLKGNKLAGTGFRLKYPAETGKSKISNPSPFGHTDSTSRQTSAVYFRPLAISTKKGDIQYALLIFQAPDSVLGEKTIKHVGMTNTRVDLT